MRAAALATLALLSTSCAHPAQGEHRPAPGQVNARGFLYIDEAGLSVTTVSAKADQAITERVQLNVAAAADHVVNTPVPKITPQPPGPGQPSGHFHPGVDIVSSASVLAADVPVKTDEWRFEGQGGATWALRGRDPLQLQATARASYEPDYRSVSARLAGTGEFFDRNLAVSAFVSLGHDSMHPLEAPPGQQEQWPASHDRWNAGALAQQLITPRLSVSGGVAFTHQWGTLASPYRRANVRNTLFPERVPGVRLRGTAFAAGSYFIGGGTALHLRQGLYADSWGVWSLIPEASIAKEVGPRFLVSFRYRFYGQGSASFYRTLYQEPSAQMTGDPRLGRLQDHVSALEVRWTPWGRLGWQETLSLVGSYQLSILHYLDLRSTVRANVFSLGATWGY